METTQISLVSVQLNKKRPFENMICISNENGILLVDRGLFVISFRKGELPKDVTIVPLL